MPAPKKIALPDAFNAMEEERKAVNEHRDCTVKALAILTGRSYGDCRKALAEAGRANRRGAFHTTQRKAIEALGFSIREWTSREKIELVMSYPKKGIAGLTTHQPRRFPQAWAPHADKLLLLYSRGHVSAYRDGVVQDWAINRAKQVYMIWELTPKGN